MIATRRQPGPQSAAALPRKVPVQQRAASDGAAMCNKEKKDKKDKREKKEKRAKKAQSGEAGASAAQCTLKLVEERKDLLSPVLSAPHLLPPPRARLRGCPPDRPPAMPAHARARRDRLAVSFPPGLLPAERLTNDEETGIRLELRRNTARAARTTLS